MGGAAPVHPLRLVHEISAVTSADTTLCLDVGSHYIWMNRYAQAERARQVLVSNGQQTLGVALPWAIAAGMVRPGSPVISVSGDGGFGQYMNELLTAVKYDMNITHVLLNNSELGKISKEQRAGDWEVWETSLHNPDFAEYARICGAHGERVTDKKDIESALKRALAHEGPSLVELVTDAELV